MAQEICVTQQIQVTNGNFKFPKTGPVTQLIDQATAGGGNPGTIQAVTTANGTLVDFSTFPGITAGGWLQVTNLDPTNYVSWGPDNGAGTLELAGELLPGESALFRMSRGQQKYRFQANTAICNVQVSGFAK